MNSTTEEYSYNDADSSYEDILKLHTEDTHPEHCREAACIITAILNVIIFLLGITGNGAVIWIAGFKMKKSVNTTWYLSLALSDFLFCSIIPFIIIRIVRNNWIFGLFMCKFTSFAMFLNMYSSIFILIVISVDCCVTVKFPVWAQNRRTVTKASAVVVLVWLMSAFLSIPAFRFREIHISPTKGIQCGNNYEHHHTTIVLIRFICGFLIPFLSICICYSILICKLRVNQLSKFTKPYKIMTLLITIFFLCWLPYHIVSIIELNQSKHGHNLDIAQQVTATLASSNSFLNPFLYAFMAKDLKKKLCSFLSKIESAIDEETRSAFTGT
ncbi:C3a anaphylatoxin chemotactic receptor-like isoform X3 [Xyrauchen texanus]|uniref:C3a anaphylatoxin chemotactic receptor-like isoform X2 n=1 Tax=Xyrauchen texanus TaxID=154827 RepID=UPI0022425B0D|nr:C3a anaphylatoxin chemotactic receptor-like isoform X2 [Xyrauchen texanus]XP_051951379.1 C3a anaphylatoxin chemotactic receptor-like isoform X3 [Xyrauchen texanus]